MPSMNVNIGTSGGGNQPIETPLTPTTTETSTNKPSTHVNTLDTISTTTQTSSTATFLTTTYNATQQFPQIAKPQDKNNPENKTSKDTSADSAKNTQQGQGLDTTQQDQTVQQQAPPHQGHQQDDQGGGQQGGQQGSGEQQGGGQQGGGNQQGSGGFQSKGSPTATLGLGDLSGNGSPTVTAPPGLKVTDTTDVKTTATTSTPGTTTPVSTQQTPTLANPPTYPAQAYQNFAALYSEAVNTMKKLMLNVPDGPSKIKEAEYLKAIGLALVQFQITLSEVEQINQQIARDRSMTQYDATKTKIDIQKSTQSDIDAANASAQSKADSSGSNNDALKWFEVVMTAIAVVVLAPLAMFPPLGTLAYAMLVCELVDQCMKLNDSSSSGVWGPMMDSVSSSVDSMLDYFSSTYGIQYSKDDYTMAEYVTKIFFVALVCVAMIANPTLAMVGTSAFTDMLSATKIVTQSAKLAGADEATQQEAEMITQIVIACIAVIGSLAMIPFMPAEFGNAVASAVQSVTSVVTKITNAIAQLAEKIATVSETAAKITQTILTALVKLILDPMNWVTATQAGLSTASGIETYNLDMIKAQIAILTGKQSSGTTEIDALIEILKKIIKKLMDALQEIGQTIGNTGQVLQNMYKNSSDIVTNLYA